MVWPWFPPLYLSPRPPPESVMRDFARGAADAPLAVYPRGCIESGVFPRGWIVNLSEATIGHGRADYMRAVAALGRLECMEIGWLRLCETEGGVFAVWARQIGVLWLMNANRMLPASETVASGVSTRTVGWHCTRKHVLAGEEQLRVQWDHASGAVTFRVLSYSRPRHVCSVVALPLVLVQQRRFARDVQAAMRRAAAASGGATSARRASRLPHVRSAQ